jgi:hypothetical protein
MMLKRKLAQMFPSAAARASADAVLMPVISGREGERVAMACLKLAGSDLGKLKDYAEAAAVDYRDVLAWAEYPRQMEIGPNAPSEEQQRARRADAEEYARWLDAHPTSVR